MRRGGAAADPAALLLGADPAPPAAAAGLAGMELAVFAGATEVDGTAVGAGCLSGAVDVVLGLEAIEGAGAAAGFAVVEGTGPDIL